MAHKRLPTIKRFVVRNEEENVQLYVRVNVYDCCTVWYSVRCTSVRYTSVRCTMYNSATAYDQISILFYAINGQFTKLSLSSLCLPVVNDNDKDCFLLSDKNLIESRSGESKQAKFVYLQAHFL